MSASTVVSPWLRMVSTLTMCYRAKSCTMMRSGISFWPIVCATTLPGVDYWSHKGLNNRAEKSHLPLRRRERMMQSFRSAGGLQGFTSIFSAVRNLFVPPRSRGPAWPPICTASSPWRNGEPRQACTPEANKAGLTAVSASLRDIIPDHPALPVRRGRV